MLYALKFFTSNQRKYFQRNKSILFALPHFIRSVWYEWTNGTRRITVTVMQPCRICFYVEYQTWIFVHDILSTFHLKTILLFLFFFFFPILFASAAATVAFGWFLFRDFARMILYIFLLSWLVGVLLWCGFERFHDLSNWQWEWEMEAMFVCVSLRWKRMRQFCESANSRMLIFLH